MKTRFPDPPKPPLPPPPLPPLSTLNNLGGKAKLKLALSSEREQLVYSRFLQNFIFKYNNRNVHKICNKIDLANLEYLLINDEIEGKLGLNRSSPVLSLLANQSNNSDKSLLVTAGTRLGSLLTTLTTTTPTNEPASMTRVIMSTSTSTRSPPPVMLTNIYSKQFENIETRTNSSSRSASDIFLFEFVDEYLTSVMGKFNADPWKFFLNCLLVPAIVLLVFIVFILIGFIIKR